MVKHQLSLLPLLAMCDLIGVSNSTRQTGLALAHRSMQCCESRYYLGESTGLPIQFRDTLASLLKTRLNPRARPFIPSAVLLLKQWHYILGSKTKHPRPPTIKSAIASLRQASHYPQSPPSLAFMPYLACSSSRMTTSSLVASPSRATTPSVASPSRASSPSLAAHRVCLAHQFKRAR